MKKLVLAIALLSLASPAAFAQGKSKVKSKTASAQVTEHPVLVANPQSAATVSPGTPAAEKPTTLKPENMAFNSDHFDFGTVPEGGPADHVFTFTNTGKEPLIIQRVQPSCGCTTPDWSKEPIAPGATGMIKASFATQGRAGKFDKTMTVFSNAGTRTISFGGTVEKAPETSVPQNGSIMRN